MTCVIIRPYKQFTSRLCSTRFLTRERILNGYERCSRVCCRDCVIRFSVYFLNFNSQPILIKFRLLIGRFLHHVVFLSYDKSKFISKNCRELGEVRSPVHVLVHGLFVPWTIRTLDYSYHRWTIRTLDCS